MLWSSYPRIVTHMDRTISKVGGTTRDKFVNFIGLTSGVCCELSCFSHPMFGCFAHNTSNTAEKNPPDLKRCTTFSGGSTTLGANFSRNVGGLV